MTTVKGRFVRIEALLPVLILREGGEGWEGLGGWRGRVGVGGIIRGGGIIERSINQSINQCFISMSVHTKVILDNNKKRNKNEKTLKTKSILLCCCSRTR